MYGFHKRVGLSDNSMRASERKNKSPSEYSNPYFRRGHPNLLWLINKPKSGKTKAKNPPKHTEGDAESDEDGTPMEEPAQPERITNAPYPARALPAGDVSFDRSLVTAIKNEITRINTQQKTIMHSIERIQRENKDLYARAAVFQEQHDRHQNSINAILNFLANVFRKTLEDQNGSQNVTDLLANIIPGVNGNNPMHQGSVVDLGDLFQSQAGGNTMNQTKRARGLLPPIPGPNAGRASTVSSTPSTNATPQPFNNNNNQAHASGTVEELFDSPDNPSPEYLAQELKSNPHESMMKIIQDTNANNNSNLDLPEVVANTPTTMTSDQRQQMLSNMMAQSSAPSSGSIPSTSNMASNLSASAPQQNTQNAQQNLSLSPALGSHAQPAPFSHPNFENNSEQIETLRRMSQDNDNKIQQLQNMLGPLSPSGRIPGFDGVDLAHNYFGSPSPDLFNLDNYINTDAYANNGTTDFPANFGGPGDEFDFTMPAAVDSDHLAPGHLGFDGAINSTPSPSGTEEIQRDDIGDGDADHDAKRRRVND